MILGTANLIKLHDDEFFCTRCQKMIIPLIIEDEETESFSCEDCFLDEMIQQGLDIKDPEPIEDEVSLAIGNHAIPEEDEAIWESYCG